MYVLGHDTSENWGDVIYNWAIGISQGHEKVALIYLMQIIYKAT
jgi:hypothetical protein